MKAKVIFIYLIFMSNSIENILSVGSLSSFFNKFLFAVQGKDLGLVPIEPAILEKQNDFIPPVQQPIVTEESDDNLVQAIQPTNARFHCKGLKFYNVHNKTTDSFTIPINFDAGEGFIPVILFYSNNSQTMPTIVNNVHVEGSKQNQVMQSSIENNILMKISKTSRKLQDQFKNIFLKNKKSLILCSIVCSYSFLFAYLSRISYFLSKDSCWSCWKQKLNFQDLLKISDAELISEILETIYERYKFNKNDFLTPLLQFMNDLEKEELFLKNYVWWSKTLEKIYLKKLFLINDTIMNSANERLNKLAFLKSRVINWASNKKVLKNPV